MSDHNGGHWINDEQLEHIAIGNCEDPQSAARKTWKRLLRSLEETPPNVELNGERSESARTQG